MSRTSIAFTGSSGRSMTIRATPDASAGTNVTDGRALGVTATGFSTVNGEAVTRAPG
jgi:hypothetical protein